MKKLIIILVIAIILVSIIIIYMTGERVSEIYGKEGQKMASKPSEETGELGEMKPTAAGGDSGNGRVGGSGVGESAAGEEEKELPSDIETAPCGFYFAEYDVCKGTCPEGSCVQEGKSCYCKKV